MQPGVHMRTHIHVNDGVCDRKGGLVLVNVSCESISHLMTVVIVCIRVRAF